MKRLQENTKITLTFGSLKRLVNEATSPISTNSMEPSHYLDPGNKYQEPSVCYYWGDKEFNKVNELMMSLEEENSISVWKLILNKILEFIESFNDWSDEQYGGRKSTLKEIERFKQDINDFLVKINSMKGDILEQDQDGDIFEEFSLIEIPMSEDEEWD